MSPPLTLGGLSAQSLVAEFGSPIYVYDEAVIAGELAAWQQALAGYTAAKLCYAVKANSSLKLLDYFAKRGISFDIVSGGELARLQKVGVPGHRIVFSGVGKSHQEMEQALAAGIYCFNLESVAEMERLAEVGRVHGVKIPVAVRVNPDIDAKTHPYISTGLTNNKFGINIPTLREVAERLGNDPWLAWHGLDCHIGSNMHDPEPYHRAAETLFELAEWLIGQGVALKHLDFGGGIGVRYRADDQPPSIADFIRPIVQQAQALQKKHINLEVVFEPGRRLIAEAGVLLTKVEMLKQTPSRRFVVVDASMSELLRPALYQAYHQIVPAWQADTAAPPSLCDVVGPVCESADFLGTERMLAVQAGDGLAILTAGAYGAVMSSNYNSRPRPAEVWIEHGQATCIRRRERYDELYQLESF